MSDSIWYTENSMLSLVTLKDFLERLQADEQTADGAHYIWTALKISIHFFNYCRIARLLN